MERTEFAIDTIYHWVSPDGESEYFFYTDDGLGFRYFNSEADIREQTGIESAVEDAEELPAA